MSERGEGREAAQVSAQHASGHVLCEARANAELNAGLAGADDLSVTPFVGAATNDDNFA